MITEVVALCPQKEVSQDCSELLQNTISYFYDCQRILLFYSILF